LEFSRLGHRLVLNTLRLGIPIESSADPKPARGQDASNGFPKPAWNRSRGRRPPAKGIQPVRHVKEASSRGVAGPLPSVARQRDPRLLAHHGWIVFKIALLLHQQPARSSLGTEVHQRVLLAHEANETRRVISETRRVAD